MKYYRVKFGYGKDEFISVSEEEVRKAIGAQIKGTVAVFDEGTVAGNHIMSITPDYQREMGYHRDHSLNADDYTEIGAKRMREYTQFLRQTTEMVRLGTAKTLALKS